MLFEREGQILEHLLRGARYGIDIVNAKEGPLKRGTSSPLSSGWRRRLNVKSRLTPAPPGANGSQREYTVTAFGRCVYEARESSRSSLSHVLAAAGFFPTSRKHRK